jgi:sugar-specific transcriptional regulator TrmB
MPADLTPFGFTPTENSAYAALLELGPSGAYSVARRLSVARANAYQALDGLVAKRAASLVATGPRRYRATQPQTLLTLMVEGQASKLDRLEAQIGAEAGEGERPLVTLAGTRSLRDTATRAILRSGNPVRCVGSTAVVEALAPAIRARAAGGREISVWLLGAGPSAVAGFAGTVSEDEAVRRFNAVPLLLVADGALAAVESPAGLSGYWGADPLFVGLVDAAITAVTET